MTALALANALEVPDSVITALGEYGSVIFAPAYLPFKAALYGSPLIAPCMKLLDDFRSSHGKGNPFQDKFAGLESAHIVFFCTVYVVFFWLLPTLIFKFVWKKPVDLLRPYAIVHNAFLAVLSGYMALTITVTAVASGYSFWNNAFDVDLKHNLAWKMAKIQYIFYISKPVPEFVDTLLIAAFQNWKQMSVLHVSHHLSVPCIWWAVMNIAPSGDCHASSFANSLVHLFMYSYFLAMLIFPKGGPVRNAMDRNKYAVTILQMLQFSHNIAQGAYTLYVVKETKYKPVLIQLMVYYCSYLLLLFINFFIQNAVLGGAGGDKKKPRDEKQQPARATVGAPRPSSID